MVDQDKSRSMILDSGQDVLEVPLDQIDQRYAQLRLRSPGRVARLLRLAEGGGALAPVLLSTAVVAERLVLVDGFKRLDVVRQLGHSTILARVAKLDAVSAEVAIVNANEGQRGLSDIEEGLIVQSLHRQHGLSQVQIAGLLGRHKSWVCRRLHLIEQLESGVQNDLRLGLISASMARELVRLPRGNQTVAARTAVAHGLSSRQTARLVSVLNAADPAQRPAILNDPLGHLADNVAEEMDHSDPRLGAAGNQLRIQVLRLESSCNRILELFRKGARQHLVSGEVEILSALTRPVVPLARQALAQIVTLIGSQSEVGHEE